MGQTVKQAVAPVSAVVNKAVEGVKDIAQGNVAKGVGEIGAAYVDAGKATFGISSDNKSTTLALGKTALAEFSSNPGGFVSGAAAAYASGGASLVPEAGGSILGSIQQSQGGLSPGQLASGGGGRTPGAPMLPSNAEPVYASGRAQSDYTMVFAAVVIGAALFVSMRR